MPLDYSNILDHIGESALTPQREATLLEPFAHVHSNPGKQMHGLLITAFNHWMKVPEDKLKIIIDAVNKLHSASLMIDDVQDSSQLRRGIPTAHAIYGIPQTINAANRVYFLALRELLPLTNHPVISMKDMTPGSVSERKPMNYRKNDVIDIAIGEIVSLHQGQGLDIFWRDSLQCPTEEEYIGMVVNKTGGLLRMAIKLMELFATENIDKNYISLVNLIALYYQIRDDYMNLQSEEYTLKKGFAEDLTEGKFSFPVIHGIHADPTNSLLLNVLQKRPTMPAFKNYAISYLRSNTRSFNYTLNVLRTLERLTFVEMERLGENPLLVGIMDHICVLDM